MIKTMIRGTLLAGGLLALAGCQNEPYQRFERRFERFHALLSAGERADFQAGKFDEAGRSLAGRAAADAELGKRLAAVKDAECISFFDGPQTVRFFAETIVVRRDFYVFLDLLDEREKNLFTGRRFAELAGSLDKRAGADAALRGKLAAIRTTSRLEGKPTADLAAFFHGKIVDY